MKDFTDQKMVESGQRTVRLEADAVTSLVPRIDARFAKACRLILACKGRVVVTGMGKSGHIGNKIAATLASTGTPAFFMHPGEANHGDLGMITRGDVVIAISNSGTSTEIVSLLPTLKHREVPLIVLTGRPQSTLAEVAAVHLDISVQSEACPLDLAPTSSTTVTLVLGDALAVALLEARGFTAEDFALSHPGGLLGRRLLLRIEDIMHSGAQIPKVDSTTSLLDALSEITAKGFGMTTVCDVDGILEGVFTDGDLRRSLDKGSDIHSVTMASVMSRSPSTVSPKMLAVEALNIMETRKITALVVADARQKPIGILHMHDLLRAGLA